MITFIVIIHLDHQSFKFLLNVYPDHQAIIIYTASIFLPKGDQEVRDNSPSLLAFGHKNTAEMLHSNWKINQGTGTHTQHTTLSLL